MAGLLSRIITFMVLCVVFAPAVEIVPTTSSAILVWVFGFYSFHGCEGFSEWRKWRDLLRQERLHRLRQSVALLCHGGEFALKLNY
jgi:hypothetical protein